MADDDGGADVFALGGPMHDVVIAEAALELAERGMHEEGGFVHGSHVWRRRAVAQPRGAGEGLRV
ncbi:MAG: hypothetical protein BroJett013_27680 [Alphaproteobacteria bacterium]|nr:MAG: hypothetical protein BroJett013_27680 [Alphaproteobacteria bacterium]